MNDSDDGAGAIGTEEFDWNSIKDDKNIELWLVRVPDSVCPFLRFSPSSFVSVWPLVLAPVHPWPFPGTYVVEWDSVDGTLFSRACF